MTEQAIGTIVSGIVEKLDPADIKGGREIVAERPTHNAVTTPMEMIDRAISSGASIETLERLMALQERWESNHARKAFDAAIAAAKDEIPVIKKRRSVDFTSQKGRTNYRFEDLATIANVITPILARHGLSYRFRTETQGAVVSVTCIVSHRDGHSEENTLSAGHDNSGNKNSIQAVGSTITYLQRYTLKAALGLASSEDDDGGKADQKPGGAITAEQYTIICDLIDRSGRDEGKLCAYLGIEHLDEMPADKFDGVKQMLEKSLAKGGAHA